MKFARSAVVGIALMLLSAGPAPAWSRPLSPSDHVRPAPLTQAQEGGSHDVGPSPLWKKRFNGAPGQEVANALAVSPNGTTVFVTGASGSQGLASDYETVAYDASSGAQLWVASYDGPAHGSDSAGAISVSPDGGSVYVTGSSQGVDTGDDYATVAYDALTGDQRWVARYNGPHISPNLGDSASKVMVSPDGGSVFVTGTSDRDDKFATDYATVGYDAATGAQRWVARYCGPPRGTCLANGLAIAPDGLSVFVTGTGPGFGTADDYVTVAYDASTGSAQWVARFAGDGDLRGDFAQSIVASPDGSAVVVTGTSDNDYATVAYDPATGSQRWVATWDGEDVLDWAAALAVDPGSRAVYVTGQTCCVTGSNDLLTVGYDLTTGEQRWVAQFDLAGFADFGASIIPSPDGATVFVAGTATSVEGTLEWAIVAYMAGTGQEGSVTTGPRCVPPPGYGCTSPGRLAISPDGNQLFVTGSINKAYGTIGYQLR